MGYSLIDLSSRTYGKESCSNIFSDEMLDTLQEKYGIENPDFEVLRHGTSGITVMILEKTKQSPAGEPVATFTLDNLPGNSCFCVSSEMRVYTAYQRRGIAQYLQDIKVKIAQACEFSFLMAVVNVENEAQMHIMKKSGWQSLHRLTTDLDSMTRHYWHSANDHTFVLWTKYVGEYQTLD